MNKYGSKLISLSQYRFTDLFLFLVIDVIGVMLPYLARMTFPGAALFTLTFTVPIVLLVMMRWGWWSVFYAVIDGVISCAVYGGTWPMHYLAYAIGNSAMMLLLVLLKFVGKRKIASKWYFSVLFVFLGWVLLCLGRTAVFACFGESFLPTLGLTMGLGETGLLSLGLAVILILVLRRFDGMFEDQKLYLLRKDAERKEMARRDEFGDEPIDLDEETLAILKKDDDGK